MSENGIFLLLPFLLFSGVYYMLYFSVDNVSPYAHIKVSGYVSVSRSMTQIHHYFLELSLL